MKVTLIMPNLGCLESGAYIDEGSMEPLPLAVLAGLTPPDVECVLYDDRIEPVPFDEPTDLVAISVEIYTARRSYEIAAEYRERGVPVVMGGMHPTLLPAESLEHADAVLLGDAEPLWARLVEDARRGRLRRVYRSRPGVAQAGGVLPRRDLFRGKRYLPVTLMQFSRGCRFACSFCAISSYFGREHFVRRTREVLDEITAQDRRFVFFVDDNFLSDHAAAKAFLRELIPMRVRWVSQASIDMTADHELMQLLADSGCVGNVIGFESLERQNLRAMAKGPAFRMRRRDGKASTRDRYADAVTILRDHHLQTWAAFTLGHDHDTPESIREVADFALEHKFCFGAPGLPSQPRRLHPGADVGRGADRGVLAGTPAVECAGVSLASALGFPDAPAYAAARAHVPGLQPDLPERDAQETGHAARLRPRLHPPGGAGAIRCSRGMGRRCRGHGGAVS
jgi:hypothetical protein